jgi:prephenate dehydratase
VSRVAEDEARPVVAYQGEPGAFSEEAIVERWGSRARALSCPTFAEVTRVVQEGVARFGMLPVENSTAGRVEDSIAAIAGAGLASVGTHELRIRLCLLALPGATLETLRSVESHPVALRQCRRFLETHGWLAPREAFDTAGAARLVAAADDPTRGAVASARAGETYGLVALAEGIEDRSDNVTRFTIVASKPSAVPSRALDPQRPHANLER